MSVNSSPPPQFITQPPLRGVKRSASPEPDMNGGDMSAQPAVANGTNGTNEPYVPKLMYTSFPIKGFTILPTRNITSNYLRSDASYFPGEKPGSNKIAPDVSTRLLDLEHRLLSLTILASEQIITSMGVGLIQKPLSETFLGHPKKEGSDVIIIHPGSRHLRVGRASEAFPRTVPHVIARKMTKPVEPPRNLPLAVRIAAGPKVGKKEKNNDMDVDEDNDDEASSDDDSPPPASAPVDDDAHSPAAILRALEHELRYRMKLAKRRPVANAHAQVTSFNASVVPENIPDHNDPYKVEWTDVGKNGETGPPFLIGQKALRLPSSALTRYRLLYPMRHGTLNCQDYDSLLEVLGDLETIWTEAIREELEIEKKELRECNAVLVIPDTYNRAFVAEVVTMMLRFMRFRGVFVQQESASATFGAGISVACVVDIGAQKTSIACVEDGMCLPDSRYDPSLSPPVPALTNHSAQKYSESRNSIFRNSELQTLCRVYLNYGGDDITTFFTALLLRNRFPYADIDLARAYDWRLAEELKEKFCTMNEAEISVQVYDFFTRVPDKATKKYQLKVYDEVILAPMCMFFPAVIDFAKKLESRKDWASSNVTDDVLDDGVGANAFPLLLLPGSSKSKIAATAPLTFSPSPRPAIPPVPPSQINNAFLTPGPSDAADTPGSTPAASVIMETPLQVAVAQGGAQTVEAASSHVDATSTPIDVAIAQSIQAAAGVSEEKIKKFYSSVILVGGGGLVSGFERMLADRIATTAIAQAAGIDRADVLPAPREMDPRLLVWKGASVLSKLDTASEMWIGESEWDEVGVRCLRDRVLFVW
ncbi:hypothetical protein BC937DRAFT_86544 [Endogone sp. FLAS-F59071]|nr:hypothetical protein BC937DRAFT_86544 [Endogone sp. FLAS-F59071]|eukprot:RUS20029.1 hypothetical protein BC937DRAFT_86544 [Endogone sp. FLAS-F59071]